VNGKGKDKIQRQRWFAKSHHPPGEVGEVATANTTPTNLTSRFASRKTKTAKCCIACRKNTLTTLSCSFFCFAVYVIAEERNNEG
jgi:hypothetical protein